jgi:hypothetical protein
MVSTPMPSPGRRSSLWVVMRVFRRKDFAGAVGFIRIGTAL